jgi:hypothetical protein
MWCCGDSQDVGLEAAIIKRKRNSSLVKRHCAENPTGLKHTTEATEPQVVNKVHKLRIQESIFKIQEIIRKKRDYGEIVVGRLDVV